MRKRGLSGPRFRSHRRLLQGILPDDCGNWRMVDHVPDVWHAGCAAAYFRFAAVFRFAGFRFAAVFRLAVFLAAFLLAGFLAAVFRFAGFRFAAAFRFAGFRFAAVFRFAGFRFAAVFRFAGFRFAAVFRFAVFRLAVFRLAVFFAVVFLRAAAAGIALTFLGSVVACSSVVVLESDIAILIVGVLEWIERSPG